MSFPRNFQRRLLEEPARRVVLSGPSGFLGARVLDIILKVHDMRESAGFDPGEVVLLSSKPESLMDRLSMRYGRVRMQTVRCSRVDYFKQHDMETWVDHLGSLGCAGPNAAFVNIAGVAGPRFEEKSQKLKSMLQTGRDEHKINYAAAIAAASACRSLKVGHFVQSSTQATKTERAGQVPYSRGKMMADFNLSRLASPDLHVTIARLGLLYCRKSMAVGQERSDNKLRGSALNLADLSLLPCTPVMGSGRALLQPQEVQDAAARLAFLALSCPSKRPPGVCEPLDNAHDGGGGGGDEVGQEPISWRPGGAPAIQKAPLESAGSSGGGPGGVGGGSNGPGGGGSGNGGGGGQHSHDRRLPEGGDTGHHPQTHHHHNNNHHHHHHHHHQNHQHESPPVCDLGSAQLRVFDAVGPEAMSMAHLLERFAHYQGNSSFSPVYVDYRRFEELLDVKSFGNLNRQFVSLLRSEDGPKPLMSAGGSDPTNWDRLLEDYVAAADDDDDDDEDDGGSDDDGNSDDDREPCGGVERVLDRGGEAPSILEEGCATAEGGGLGDSSHHSSNITSTNTTKSSTRTTADNTSGARLRLLRLDEAFASTGRTSSAGSEQQQPPPPPLQRRFPYGGLVLIALKHPQVVGPGVRLGAEVLRCAWKQGSLPPWKPSGWQWWPPLWGRLSRSPEQQQQQQQQPWQRERTPKQQAELFLGRFGKDEDVTRDAVMLLLTEFEAAKGRQQGQERRPASTRAHQGEAGGGDRQLEEDESGDFLSLACAVFGKQWNLGPEEVARLATYHDSAR